MRVLHFFKTYLPDTTGGIEQVIFQLCQGTRPLGVENRVLTLSKHPEPPLIQVADHWVRRAHQNLYIASTGFSLEVFGQFREMARKADIVHFHFPWPMADLVHFCTRHGRPTVVSYHSDIIKQQLLLNFYRPLMNRFLQSVDRILVASPNYLQSSSTLRPFTDKTIVVPYGLDPASYPQAAPQRLAYWREKLPAKFFLFVGVLRYYKGLNSLLEALSGTGYPLVIIGAGPEEQALKQQAERLGLTNIFFLGRLDDQDKVCLLQLCLALAFPSHLRSEAFGISLLEAAMFGKPMISCEIGTGTTYVNLDGETGIAVAPQAPLALRQAMNTLWNNAELARRFGERARQRFEQQFTIEQMCAKTVDVYRDLLQGQAR